jgi:ubiquinone/menaquinone biosynthesis C-methylase UbiE
MRPVLKGESLLERVVLRANQAPAPAGEALFEPAVGRALGVAARLGVFRRLARGPADAVTLAGDLGTDAGATALLADTLAAAGHLSTDGGRYSLSRRARRWLDPESPTYVGTYIESTADYWDWWARLEDVVRTGKGIEIHDLPPDDPEWERYIRGQFEMARLSAREVARKLRLPAEPESLLDVAGGHGWFSAELCMRHPSLRATVLDLDGSARVGRRIIAEHGMEDRVEHRVGDLLTSELGGPHSAALVFNIVHHLTPEQIVGLLRRLNEALAPGGTVAVLDFLVPEEGRPGGAGAMLGLFFFLTSSAGTYRERDLREWLTEAGFERPRKIAIRRLPDFALLEARKPG